MKIKELLDKYYFHDSLITKISYNNKVKIDIELCNWKQKGRARNERSRINF